MKLEHVAINVASPKEAAEWYVKNLGMEIILAREQPPFIHFLSDESGKITIELYNNSAYEIPDYPSMHPQQLHFAFVSHDPDADQKRLIDAGATLFSDEVTPQGARLVMLRDPWGLPLQLCKRPKSILRD